MHVKRKIALLTLAIAASIAGATGVHAQDEHGTTIERQLLACDAIGDTSERLACFDSVVENLGRDKASEATGPIERPIAVSLTETSTNNAAAPAAAGEVVAASASVLAASEISQAGDVQAVAVEASQEPSQAQPPADRQQALAETADEDLDEKDLSGTAAIVRVWQNLDGRFSVELDNGQVWRETEGSRVGMPKVGNAVEVSRAAFGSYQMKIDGIARKARVRRTN
ncbi:MAG: hypothetical protein L0Y45_04980 [Woeseiaceae bacterium]|nr:hypothetical protein [Woeseiaceae bacterium]